MRGVAEGWEWWKGMGGGVSLSVSLYVSMGHCGPCPQPTPHPPTQLSDHHRHSLHTHATPPTTHRKTIGRQDGAEGPAKGTKKSVSSRGAQRALRRTLS